MDIIKIAIALIIFVLLIPPYKDKATFKTRALKNNSIIVFSEERSITKYYQPNDTILLQKNQNGGYKKYWEINNQGLKINDTLYYHKNDTIHYKNVVIVSIIN